MHKKLFIALILVGLAAGGLYLYARHRATTVVDEQMERLVSSNIYDTLEYESLDLGMTGDLQLQNVRVAKDDLEVVLQEVKITNMDYAHETPWHLDVEIDGIHFPQGLPDFASLGSAPMTALLNDVVQDDTIPLNLRYGYDYNPDESHQLVSSVSAALADYFTMTMDGESRNVPLDTMMALNNGSIAPAQMLDSVTQMLSTLEIPQARIALQDEGIVESWIASTAAARGMQAEELREQLQSQARNYYVFLPQNAQGIGMQAGMQVAAFLDGERTLSVAIAPDFGGSFSRLQQEAIGALFTGDMKKIADMLHLEIQTQ
jgi:hypothetical protein